MTQQKPFASRVALAGKWATLQNIAREGLGFLVFLILARAFLKEDEFGIVALANSFVMFAQIAGRLGLGTALIRARTLTDRHRTACFWALVGFSLVLALLLVILAGTFADWAGEPRIKPVLQVLTIGLILTFASLTHEALLQRDMKFRPLAKRTFVAGLAGGLAAIAAALLGAGVWSLVVLNLVTSGTSMLLLWRALPWRPDFMFPLSELQELLPTGLRVTGIGLVRYVGASSDRLIVGFFLSIADLGLLYVGQRLIAALQTLLTQSINAVALPAFSECQDDVPRLCRAYLKALHLCLTVTGPVFVGLALLSDQAVGVFLGQQWAGVASLLAVLALAAATAAPLYFGQPLLIAIDRSGLALRIATLGAVTQIVCVAAGAWFGLFGVGVGLLVRQLIMNGVWMGVVSREIGLAYRDFLQVMRGPLSALCMMALVIFALIFTTSFSALGDLLVTVPTGALTYGAALWFLDRPALLLTLDILRKMRG